MTCGRMRMLLRNCCKFTGKFSHDLFITFDDGELYEITWAKKYKTMLIRVGNSKVFFVFIPSCIDWTASQRMIDKYGAARLFEHSAFIVYKGSAYRYDGVTGQKIVKAVINNVDPAVYALIGDGGKAK
jgi:hypothetical protein